MSRVTDICEWQKATTPEQVLALIADASEKVSDMCSGSGRWRMSIPVDTDDHDVVIGNALCAAKQFIDRAATAGTVPDETCDAIILELHDIATHFDPANYGLPIMPEHALRSHMQTKIRAIIATALSAPQATGADTTMHALRDHPRTMAMSASRHLSLSFSYTP